MKSIMLISLIAGVVYAGQPQPPVIIYGQIRDEFGYPKDEGAEVAVLDLTNALNECGSYVLDGAIHIGVNYSISVPLEDAKPFIRTNATQQGNPAKVVVRIDGVEQPTVPAGAFTVPQPGGALKLDLSIAQDVDGDGLPDAWEELMVAWSGGMFSSIQDINPNDDPDGDGMSNYKEYLAGTFPFLATDLFEITRSERNSVSGRIALTFSTVSTHKYHVLISGSLSEPEWNQAALALTVDGELEYQVLNGTGREMTVYVDGDLSSAFFCIGAN